MATTITHQDAPTFQNYVGGRWVSANSKRVASRRNPADCNDMIGHVPLASEQDVGQAVEAGLQAAAGWRNCPAPARGKLLLTAASLLEQRSNEFATALTREEGKTLAESGEEVALAIKVLEYMAGEGRRLTGETLPSEHPGRFIYTMRQPLGVVGLITPWNYPVAVPIWKMAPALVCGNTIVWKPSRLTPLISQKVAELFVDAGLPPGVLNVVNGSGAEAGRAVVEHPGVRGISFTSSFEVGAEIYSKAASLFKKVQCEAGGKNAAIVLADADLEFAADSISTGAFRYTGQRCTATSRMIVVEEIADALAEMLVNRAGLIVVGDGMEPDTTMGPVADESQIGRVLELIESGKREGDLLCGGYRLTGPRHVDGLFIGPTIVDRVPAQAAIAQEEIFGPVLSIVRVKNAEEALQVANSNRYGMVASIFSGSAGSVMHAAENLECGIVHINGPTIGAEVHAPFGGIKDAGVGERELGSTAKNFFTELKVVYVNQR
jgi:alpha-ketoglutaric semialdehyde dehydrogenase